MPADLTATAISANRIDVSWSAARPTTSRVTGYRLTRNGTLVATTTATSFSDTAVAPQTNYSYTVTAFDAGGNSSAPSAAASATTPAIPDTTNPTVSLTAPAAGANLAGTVTVSATASDNVGVTGVQFKLDGANLGPEDTSAPYTLSWNTTSATSGPHQLTASRPRRRRQPSSDDRHHRQRRQPSPNGARQPQRHPGLGQPHRRHLEPRPPTTSPSPATD